MNVMVIGSGGREHALCWAIAKSAGKHKITCAPGNAGTEALGQNADLDIEDSTEILDYCKANDIEFVVIGPEAPLMDGLADTLRAHNIAVFGPGKSGARLEGSKVFAKNFCYRHGIPTSVFHVFDDKNKAHKHIDKYVYDTCVVKADGLAAGKGVIVCDDPIDAHSAVDTILVEKKFGNAGNSIIIEDRLEGFETTLLTIVAGGKYVKLPYSQDHKREYDGNKGRNTGGMGVFAPTPKITPELDEVITNTIVEPTISALLEDKIDFRGCLYFGLMITEEGPAVLEFNVRFGDPEAQAVLPLMEGDFLGALYAASQGDLSKVELIQSEKRSLVVILASSGYPGSYRKNVDITSGIKTLEKNKDLIIFHAGTMKDGKRILTTGGRVIAVTCIGSDFHECRSKVYGAIDTLKIEGLRYRTDIGKELVTAR